MDLLPMGPNSLSRRHQGTEHEGLAWSHDPGHIDNKIKLFHDPLRRSEALDEGEVGRWGTFSLTNTAWMLPAQPYGLRQVKKKKNPWSRINWLFLLVRLVRYLLSISPSLP